VKVYACALFSGVEHPSTLSPSNGCNIPITSILVNSYPIALSRVLHYFKPPPARGVDACCGTGIWSYWIRKHMPGYSLVTCDLVRRGKLKPDVLCDLSCMPFKHLAFDFLIADLPFPWKKGKRYGGLSSIEEF